MGALTVPKLEVHSRQEWLEERRSGLGGSDAASVLGISKWKSRLALWAEKTGQVEEPNLEEVEYVEWGNILEDPIAQRYTKITGRTLIDHGRFAIRINEKYPFMHCTMDREIPFLQSGAREPFPAYASGNGDLSIKNTSEFKKKDWEEEAPAVYQAQLQHELAVTGLQWGSFGVLIGGNRFHWMDVPRNDRFISLLIEKEEEFWDMVQRGICPEPDDSDSSKETLLRLYPQDTGESRALPPEFADLKEQRQGLKVQIKALEEELQGMDNRIKAAIGDAAIGLLPDGSGFSWKKQHRDSYTVQASDFRVLREIKAGKGKK